MWLTDEKKIKKAKSADKKEYGHEGFDSNDGYVSFQSCMDFVKLLKTGVTASTLAEQYKLSLPDILTIITYWTQYLTPDADMQDIKLYGGKEHSEIQKIKKNPPISQEDIQNILIDLH